MGWALQQESPLQHRGQMLVIPVRCSAPLPGVTQWPVLPRKKYHLSLVFLKERLFAGVARGYGCGHCGGWWELGENWLGLCELVTQMLQGLNQFWLVMGESSSLSGRLKFRTHSFSVLPPELGGCEGVSLTADQTYFNMYAVICGRK